MVKQAANVKGVILAGGWSSRFGTNKALARFQNTTLIERVISSLSEVFPDLLIVTNTPEDYERLKVPMLTDLTPHQGPMGGIVTALAASHQEQGAIFITACDLPLLLPELIHTILNADRTADAVIPVYEGRGQYLSALYSRRLEVPMLEYLQQGKNSLKGFFAEYKNVVWLPTEKNYFVNVNYRTDLESLSYVGC